MASSMFVAKGMIVAKRPAVCALKDAARGEEAGLIMRTPAVVKTVCRSAQMSGWEKFN